MGKRALPHLRIAVVGVGAVGSYYGAKLAKFGRDVHFLMRSDWREVLRSGIRVRGKTENIHVAKGSGYIDHESGQPLEIEPIWGGPLRRATAPGAQMPELAALYAQLKPLDANRRLPTRVSA